MIYGNNQHRLEHASEQLDRLAESTTCVILSKTEETSLKLQTRRVFCS